MHRLAHSLAAAAQFIKGNVMYGRAVAKEVRQEVREQVAELQRKHGQVLH
jgi:hypothetical protein